MSASVEYVLLAKNWNPIAAIGSIVVLPATEIRGLPLSDGGRGAGFTAEQTTNKHTHTRIMSNFNYHFVRKLYGATLTIDVSGINGHVDVVMHIGSTPCWSDGFLTSGNGCHWSGYKASRVQALRFAQCAFVNMHGFSSSSAGNNPNKPARVHSPSEFRAFKRKAAKP